MVEYSYICDKEDNMKRNLEWHDENGKATPLYRKWAGARRRCYNKHDRRYPLYGGRGIRMCDEWLMSFRTFAEWAYGHGYRTGLSLDRIDNDGNYCPENCRFVTMDEQKRNRRFCHRVTFNGREFRTLQEVADHIGIKQNTLTKRLSRGWPMELALSMRKFKGRAPREYDIIIQQEKRKSKHVHSDP